MKRNGTGPPTSRVTSNSSSDHTQQPTTRCKVSQNPDYLQNLPTGNKPSPDTTPIPGYEVQPRAEDLVLDRS